MKKTERKKRVKLEDAEECCGVMMSIGAAKLNPYILASKPEPASSVKQTHYCFGVAVAAPTHECTQCTDLVT
jgi:hypothetical protein